VRIRSILPVDRSIGHRGQPDALAIADALDGERRGPLHGVPVLITDNIDTADHMSTPAVSRALEDSICHLPSPPAKFLATPDLNVQ
jgi:Asp-tRNA(Asn)/Glu-tRNA(Gln) amidotransferase A subunit family amidase